MLRMFAKRKNDFFPPIDMQSQQSKDVSASDFLAVLEENQSNIKSMVFIAPKLGSKGWGFFRVQWK